MKEVVADHRRGFLATMIYFFGSMAARGQMATLVPSLTDTSGKNANGNTLPLEDAYHTFRGSTGLNGEAEDRLLLRRLVDAWAHCADRRLAVMQADLFIPEGLVKVYHPDPKSNSEMRGRQEILAGLSALNQYSQTFHFNGQSNVTIAGNTGWGETYCLAHQLWKENGTSKLQVIAIRYYDKFVCIKGKWLFAERSLIFDWSNTTTQSES